MKKNWFKFVIGWVAVFAFRLIPFRLPNVEPVLAVAMPFAKQYKYLSAFCFGFLSIALFDVAVGKVGMWTWITAVTYGLVAAGAYPFLKNRAPSALNFAAYGMIGTIVYDAITGVAMGPILYGQPFMEALVGQIPFTLWHLGGTLVFSLVISPVFYRWVVLNRQLEGQALLKLFSLGRA
ncbi:MAG: hypothetical protein UY56_C0028G0008 [Parcubacteria group bacterium GW2011_GWA1_50_14]|nr:MAG: hypothetical protein UY56_C0028G0008 [Parcubacteria group bacterium GW2011_GWA1_50_14]